MVAKASARSRLEVEDLVAAANVLYTHPRFDPPTIPRVVLEVHALTCEDAFDPEASAELTGLLEDHPALAAAVLRAVDLRGASRWSPGSLQEVAARFGPRGLANLALEIGTASVFSGAPGFEATMEACREHSVRVAHTAGMLAGETSVTSEPAFMAGLLHDVGTAIGLVALADRRLFPTRLPYEDVEGALEEAHERIGLVAAEIGACQTPCATSSAGTTGPIARASEFPSRPSTGSTPTTRSPPPVTSRARP